MRKSLLICAALLFVALSAKCQSAPDSTLLHLDTLNVGVQLRQAHILRYTAAATAIVGTYGGLFLYRQNDRTAEAVGTWVVAGTAAILQFIVAEVKAFRSYAILERLHPVPNGLAIKF